MRKINYHKDSKDFEAFKEEYKRCILDSNLLNKTEAENFLKVIGVQHSLEDILVLPIEELIKLPELSASNVFKGLDKKQTQSEKSRIKGIFNYTAYQTNILSNFFMKHGKELKIKTCCYCNIDFINPYIPFSNDYMDFYHFINSCIKADLLKMEAGDDD